MEVIHFNGSALFSNDVDILLGNINRNLRSTNLYFTTGYEFVDRTADARLNEDVQNLKFSASYDFRTLLGLSATSRFDLLTERIAYSSISLSLPRGSWTYNFSKMLSQSQSEKLSVSAIFEDECTLVQVAFEKRYQEVGTSEPIETLLFKLQLKTFSDIVSSKQR